MSAPRIVVRQQADDEIDEFARHIAARNLEAGKRFYDAMQAAIDRLAAMPGIGATSPRIQIAALLSILAIIPLAGCASHADPTVLHPELAVVKVTTLSSDPGQSSEGRGFFVTGDGLIVTCLHNIDRTANVIVTPPGGPPLTAQFVQEDKTNDLAIIKIAGKHYPFLHLYEGDILPGIHVRLVGSEGINHGVFDHWENLGKEMAFTARIGLSDAGAPLIGDDGRVVGVARGFVPERPDVNVAMPIWHVLQMMPLLPSMQSVVSTP